MTTLEKNVQIAVTPAYEELHKKIPPEARERFSPMSKMIFAHLEAIALGDKEKEMEIGKQIPMAPHCAKTYKSMYGKEALLEAGFNLSEANAEYGEGWLDEPDEF